MGRRKDIRVQEEGNDVLLCRSSSCTAGEARRLFDGVSLGAETPAESYAASRSFAAPEPFSIYGSILTSKRKTGNSWTQVD